MTDSALPRREQFVYVLSDGTSMWPAIRPGDMLRGHRATLENVPNGSIVLVSTEDGEVATGSRIHRLVRKIPPTSGIGGLAITAGDRTGEDEPVPLDAECVRVVEVLRRGHWKQLSSRMPPAILRLMPEWAIRLTARILRAFRKPLGTGPG
jgi:hypothetical protein